MPETRNRPGDDSGAASQQVGETSSQSTHTADILAPAQDDGNWCPWAPFAIASCSATSIMREAVCRLMPSSESSHFSQKPWPVLAWIRRRSGDPVIARRRIAAQLDELLGIDRSGFSAELDYHLVGLDLGVPEREAAAPAPMGWAA